MKKQSYFKYALIFSLIMILISCSKSHNYSDLDSFGLKGNVKSYTEKYYKPIFYFGSWKKGDLDENENHNTVKFNKDRNYSSLIFLDKNDSIKFKLIPKYQKNKIIEERGYTRIYNPFNFDKNKESSHLFYVIKYNYLTDDTIETKTFNDEETEISTSKIIYKNNKRIKEISKNLENNKISVTEYKTDKYGNLETIKTLQNDTIIFYKHFEYLEFDKIGNWIKATVFYKENSKTPDDIIIRHIGYFK